MSSRRHPLQIGCQVSTGVKMAVEYPTWNLEAPQRCLIGNDLVGQHKCSDRVLFLVSSTKAV